MGSIESLNFDTAKELDARGFWAHALTVYQGLVNQMREADIAGVTRAEALALLGRCQRQIGLYGEAQKSLLGSVQVYDELGLDKKLDVCFTLCELSVLYVEIGEFELASRTIEEIGGIQSRDHRANEFDSGARLFCSARLRLALGDIDDATQDAQESVEFFVGSSEKREAEYGQALTLLSRCQLSKSLLVEAEKNVLQALEVMEKAIGAEHPLVADSLCQLFEVLCCMKKKDGAESLLRRAQEIFDQKTGASSIGSFHVHFLLGRYKLTLDDIEAAVVHFNEAARIIEEYEPPHPLSFPEMLTEFAASYCLLNGKKYKQWSESASTEASMRARLFHSVETDIDLLIAVADHFFKHQEYDDSLILLFVALQLAMLQYGACSLEQGRVWHNLARTCLAKEDYTLAEIYYKKELGILRGEFGANSEELLGAMRMLSLCRLKLGPPKRIAISVFDACPLTSSYWEDQAGVLSLWNEFERIKDDFGGNDPAFTPGLAVLSARLGQLRASVESEALLAEYKERRLNECEPDWIAYAAQMSWVYQVLSSLELSLMAEQFLEDVFATLIEKEHGDDGPALRSLKGLL